MNSLAPFEMRNAAAILRAAPVLTIALILLATAGCGKSSSGTPGSSTPPSAARFTSLNSDVPLNRSRDTDPAAPGLQLDIPLDATGLESGAAAILLVNPPSALSGSPVVSTASARYLASVTGGALVFEDVALPEGTVRLACALADATGEPGTPLAEVVVVVDTTPPSFTSVTAAPALSLVSGMTVTSTALGALDVAISEIENRNLVGLSLNGAAETQRRVSAGRVGFDAMTLVEGTNTLRLRTTDTARNPVELVITILVELNRPPVLAAIGDQVVAEGALLSFTVTATDPDGDALTYAASGLPAGAAFDPQTRAFTYTPGFGDAGNFLDVRFSVSDGKLGDSESIAISVGDVDRPPTISAPPFVRLTAGTTASFQVTAADPDGDAITLAASGLPAGSAFDGSQGVLGVVSLAPPETRDGATYTATFVADDGRGLTRTAQTTIQVDRTPNRAPVMAPLADRTVPEAATLTFTVSATDADQDALTYAASGLPAGASFDAQTRTFTWSPGYTDAGSFAGLVFEASDGVLSTSTAIAVEVTDVNRAPTIAAPAGVQVFTGGLIAFDVTSTDADLDAVSITASGLPSYAAFASTGPGARRVTLAPAAAEAAPVTLTARFTSQDGKGGLVEASTVIELFPAPGRPPVFDPIDDAIIAEGSLISFAVSAVDPDGDALTYETGALPAGAAFDGASRTFSWTPGYEDAGVYTVRFIARDANLRDEVDVRIEVVDTDRVPVITMPSVFQLVEGMTGGFDITTSDPDGDAVTLTAEGLPPDATFDGTGLAQGRVSLAPPKGAAPATYTALVMADDQRGLQAYAAVRIEFVRAPNQPPVIDPPGDRSVSEGETLSFSVAAVDPDGDVLAFTADGLPQGAAFDAAARTFTWAPDYAQQGAYGPVTFRASDASSTTETSVTLTVLDVNRRPDITAPAIFEVRRTEQDTFTLTVLDPDADALTLTAVGLPPGASFDGSAGIAGNVTLTVAPGAPLEAYTATFTVTDPKGATASAETLIVVLDVGANRAPRLTLPATASIRENELLEFFVTAVDPDGDLASVDATDMPPGATFTAATGLFRFAPTFETTSGGASAQFTPRFTATDGVTSTSAASGVTVLDVNRPPVLTVSGTAVVEVGDAGLLVVTAMDPDGDAVALTSSRDLEAVFTVYAPGGATWAFEGTPPVRTKTVTFEAKDPAGLAAVQTTVVSLVDTRPPVLEITAPAPTFRPKVAAPDNKIPVTIVARDAAGVRTTTISVRGAAFDEKSDAIIGIVTSTSKAYGTTEVFAEADAGDAIRVTAYAYDASGNRGDAAPIEVSVFDDQPPLIRGLSPATCGTAHIAGVSLNEPILILFSERIRRDSVAPSLLLKELPGNRTVTGTVSFGLADQQVVFRPDERLLPLQRYAFTVKGDPANTRAVGISDLSGNRLTSDCYAEFVTAPEVQPGDPEILDIPCSAAVGEPASDVVPSLNVYQICHVVGRNLKPDTRLRITAMNSGGAYYKIDTPFLQVSEDGETGHFVLDGASFPLGAIYPATGANSEATTGLFTVVDGATSRPSPNGVYVQVVPVLYKTGFDPGSYSLDTFFRAARFQDLYGTGFAAGQTIIEYGDGVGGRIQTPPRRVTVQSANTYARYMLYPGVGGGDEVVVTNGGRSDPIALDPPKILALERPGTALTPVTPDRGAPAVAGVPSANLGQVLLVRGEKLSPETRVRFRVINTTGTEVTGAVENESPLYDVAADGRTGLVELPSKGIATGPVRLRDARPGRATGLGPTFVNLQIVPRIRHLDLDSVQGPATGRIVASGMLVGNTSLLWRNRFGIVVTRTAVSGVGPMRDGFGGQDGDDLVNRQADIIVPAGVVGGTVEVVTPGGVSNRFAIDPPVLIAIEHQATVGAPLGAPGAASANVGQVAIVRGRSLTRTTKLRIYTEGDTGLLRQDDVPLRDVSADGTLARVELRANQPGSTAEGHGDREVVSGEVFLVDPIVGGTGTGRSVSRRMLEIVPTVERLDSTTAPAQNRFEDDALVILRGSGFQETDQVAGASFSTVEWSYPAGPAGEPAGVVTVADGASSISGQPDPFDVGEAGRRVVLRIPPGIAGREGAYGVRLKTRFGGASPVLAFHPPTLHEVVATPLAGTAAFTPAANLYQTIEVRGFNIGPRTRLRLPYSGDGSAAQGAVTEGVLDIEVARVLDGGRRAEVILSDSRIRSTDAASPAVRLVDPEAPFGTGAGAAGLPAGGGQGPRGLSLAIVPRITSFSTTTFAAGTSVNLYVAGTRWHATKVYLPTTGGGTAVLGPLTSVNVFGNAQYLNFQLPSGVVGAPYAVETDGGATGPLTRPPGIGAPTLTAIASPRGLLAGATPGTIASTIGMVVEVSGQDLTTDTLLEYDRIPAPGTTRSRTGAATTPQAYRPLSVSADGRSARYVLADAAMVSGDVALRDALSGAVSGALRLEIVPVASIASESGGTVTVKGIGFEPGASTFVFRDAAGADLAPVAAAVASSGTFEPGQQIHTAAAQASAATPVGSDLAMGLRVVTTGGRSALIVPGDIEPEIIAVSSRLGSGRPASADEAATNVGQFITVIGRNMKSATFFYPTSDAGQFVAAGISAQGADGTSAWIHVPSNACKTGLLKVQRSGAPAHAPGGVLVQIVPTVTRADGPLEAGGTLAVGGTGFPRDTTAVVFRAAPGGVDSPVPSTPDASFAALSVTVPAGVEPGRLLIRTDGGDSAPLGGAPVLTSIDARAATGDPADPAVPSVVIGQQLLVQGANLSQATRLSVGLSGGGRIEYGPDGTIPMVVAPEGRALQFTPYDARSLTGDVFLVDASTRARSSSVRLQFVPTVTQAQGRITDGAALTIIGAGFEPEGRTEVLFRASGQPVAVTGTTTPGNGSSFTVAAPTGVEAEALRVRTPGGTSAPLRAPPLLGEIVSRAATGDAAAGATASANVFQPILVRGANLTMRTYVRFPCRDANGTAFISEAAPDAVAVDGTWLRATCQTYNLATGDVELRDVDTNQLSQAKARLHCVPTLNVFDVPLVERDRLATLRGLGFVRGETVVLLPRAGGGTIESPLPPANFLSGSNSDLQLALPEGVGAGDVRIRTLGGVSAPLLRGTPRITAIVGRAQRGAPSDASRPSANLYQRVLILGERLTMSTRVRFTTIQPTGTPGQSFLLPEFASPDGRSMRVIVIDPSFYGFATTGPVAVVDQTTLAPSDGTVLLQVVPEVDRVDAPVFAEGELATVRGRGFVKGGTRLEFAALGGARVSVEATEIFNDGYANGRFQALIPPGAIEGPITVTTLGGTSAPVDPTVGGTSPGVPAAPVILEVVSAARTGRPANPQEASANVYQVIGVRARNIRPVDAGGNALNQPSIIFPWIDDAGSRFTQTIGARTVDPDDSVTYIADAASGRITTGEVRLIDTSTGLGSQETRPLQIVPTVSNVRKAIGSGTTLSPGEAVQIDGTGFERGATSVRFPVQGGGSIEVSADAVRNFNTMLDGLTIPVLGASGDVVVTTSGGESKGFAIQVADTTPPFVQATLPTSSEQRVALDESLQVIFSEPIDVLSVLPDGAPPRARIETVPAGVTIAVEVEVMPGDAALLLHPIPAAPGAAPLAAATDYRLVIDDLVRDKAGNRLDGDRSGQALGLFQTPFRTVAIDARAPRIVSITAEARIGRPRRADLPSTHLGQLIEVRGERLKPGTMARFASMFPSPSFFRQEYPLVSASLDGTVGYVIVDPASGAAQSSYVQTGSVTLRDPDLDLVSDGSVFLQVVPTLTDFASESFRPGVRARIAGSAFAQGMMTATLTDALGSGVVTLAPLAIAVAGANTSADVILPLGAGAGVKRVQTPGGESAPLGISPVSLTAIASVAARGTAADPARPSANFMQLVRLEGMGLSKKTIVRFTTMTDAGSLGVRDLLVVTASADGSAAEVVVSDPQIVSGAVRLVDPDDGTGTGLSLGSIYLQIVPTLAAFSAPRYEVGATAIVDGSGFRFGSLRLVLPGTAGSVETRPSAASISGGNRRASVLLPFNIVGGGARVRTDGGISDPLPVGPASIASLEASPMFGAPRVAGPAANVGQSIRVVGSGMTRATRLRVTTVDSAGNRAFTTDFVPSEVAADGGAAVFILESDRVTTGPVALVDPVAGESVERPILQIVPTFTRFDAPSLAAQTVATVDGSGFVFDPSAARTFVVYPLAAGGEAEQPIASVSTGDNRRAVVVVPGGVAGPPTAIRTDGGRTLFALPLSPATDAPVLLSFAGVAASGAPAGAGAFASANVGAVVLARGIKIRPETRLEVPTLAPGGAPTVALEAPLFVSADGTQAVFAVNGGGLARSGEARLVDSVVAGRASAATARIEVVPVVSAIEPASFGAGTVVTVRGAGFVPGETEVLFQDATGALVAAASASVVVSGANATVQATAPAAAVQGPVRVRTLGGESAPRDPALTVPVLLGIVTRAATGTPADPATPSANMSQEVTVVGIGIDGSTQLRGETEPPSPDGVLRGARGVVDANPNFVAPDGRSARYSLGAHSTLLASGPVRLRRSGVNSAESAMLQVVPTLDQAIGRFDEGQTLDLRGAGFVDGGGAASVVFEGTAGPVAVRIRSVETGSNARVLVTTPAGATEGAIAIRTDGGTSAPLPGAPVLEEITTVAATGTPADGAHASMNVFQQVAVRGRNLRAQTRVIFPTTSNDGVLSTFHMMPDTFSSDGRVLKATPFVNGLATGDVLLVDAATGLVSRAARRLQIVPRLDTASGIFAPGRLLACSGSGFRGWTSAVPSSRTAIIFPSPDGSGIPIDVVVTGDRSSFSVVVPPGIGDAALFVETDGGRSAPFGPAPSITRLTARAASGRPTDDGIASANLGQEVTVVGRNLTPNVRVLVPAMTAAGTPFTSNAFFFTPISADGTTAKFTAYDASGAFITTGPVRLADGLTGLISGEAATLQIVPRLTRAEVDFFTPGELVRVTGQSFAEGATEMVFFAGRDAFGIDQFTSVRVGDVTGSNDTFQVLIPATAVPGPVAVRTSGGFTLPVDLSIGGVSASLPGAPLFAEIVAAARRGAPRDGLAPSANLDQRIAVRGENLGPSVSLVMPIIDENGSRGTSRIYPTSVSPDGRAAAFTVSDGLGRFCSGAVRLVDDAVGAGAQDERFIQIVPTITQLSPADPGVTAISPGTRLYVGGRGFVEGGTTMRFPAQGGGALSVAVANVQGFSNESFVERIPDLTIPGDAVVETDGGTSAPFFGAFVDTIPPRVESVTPRPHTGELAPLNAAITVIFSEPVRAAPLSGGAVTLVKRADGSAVVATVVTASGRTEETATYLRLALATDLAPSTEYDLRISGAVGGVTDEAGNRLDGDLNGVAGGDYVLQFTTGADTATPRIDRIADPLSPAQIARAVAGEPTDAAVASANVAQVLRIEGEGLTRTTDVVFQTIGAGGGFGPQAARVISVNAAGTVATVVMPASGAGRDSGVTTGLVTVRNGTASSARGVLLQVVPTLSSFEATSYTAGATGTFRGTGFVATATVPLFTDLSGTSTIAASARAVSIGGGNTVATLPLPSGIVRGGQRVRTPGGTSNALGIDPVIFGAIEATAAVGAAADGGRPSANIGQSITVTGERITRETRLRVTLINAAGTFSRTSGAGDIPADSVTDDQGVAAEVGTRATFTLRSPTQATGRISLVQPGSGESAGGAVLQVVPTLRSFSAPAFVPGEVATVEGTGFAAKALRLITTPAEGGGVIETLARRATIIDGRNERANVILPFGIARGGQRVRTDGGVSNEIPAEPVVLTAIEATAGVGAPAGSPSANVGQLVRILGERITPETRVRFTLGDRTTVETAVLEVSGPPEARVAYAALRDGRIASGPVRLVDPGTGASAESIELFVPPVITGFTSSGAGAQTVYTIDGLGFVAGATDVAFFDGVGAEVRNPATVQSSTRLTVTRGSGAGDPVEVVTLGGRSGPPVAGPTGAAPVITRIVASPRGGSTTHAGPAANNGQAIAIEGENLQAGRTRVVFTEQDASGLVAGQEQVLSEASPDGRTGVIAAQNPNVHPRGVVSGPVRLRNYDPVTGTPSALVLAGTLAIVPTFDRATGLYAANEVVIVDGSGFDTRGTSVLLPDGSGDVRAIEVPAADPASELTRFRFKATLSAPVLDGPLAVRTAVDPDASGTVVTSTSGPLPRAPEITAVRAIAAVGTPNDPSLPSANVGQAIRVEGRNFRAGATRVIYSRRTDTGVSNEAATSPVYVSPDGAGLVVIVSDFTGQPVQTSGPVAVDDVATGLRGTGGPRLQIVPTLHRIDAQRFEAGLPARFSGSGFVEGATTAVFTTAAGTVDVTVADVQDTNTAFTVAIPASAVPGPIYVRTLGGFTVPVDPTVGGTSPSVPAAPVIEEVLGLAASGTPRDPGQPSANLYQTILVRGRNLTYATNTTFETRSAVGSPGTTGAAGPFIVSPDGRFLTTQTGAGNPFTASGFLSLLDAASGLGSAGAVELQIVPRLFRIDVMPFRPGQVARLSGEALQEKDALDPGTTLTHVLAPTSTDGGATVVYVRVAPTDPPGITGSNDAFDFVLPQDVFEAPFYVETDGGTSEPLRAPPVLLSITGTALKGTAADPTTPSANTAGGLVAGQTIAVHGRNLTTACVMYFEKQIGDTPATVPGDDPNPGARIGAGLFDVSPDGLTAKVSIGQALITTGDVFLQDTATGLGARDQHRLQVVPVIARVSIPIAWPAPGDPATPIHIEGSGFHERDAVPIAVIFEGPGGTTIELTSADAQTFFRQGNGTFIDVDVPDGALQTSIRIRTIGGASNVFDIAGIPAGGSRP